MALLELDFAQFKELLASDLRGSVEALEQEKMCPKLLSCVCPTISALSAHSPTTPWQLLIHSHRQLPTASSAHPSLPPLSLKNKPHKWSCWLTKMRNSWTHTFVPGQTSSLMSSMTLIWRSEDDVPPYPTSTQPSTQPLTSGTSMMYSISTKVKIFAKTLKDMDLGCSPSTLSSTRSLRPPPHHHSRIIPPAAQPGPPAPHSPTT
ncbi:hypothetical protein UPYG_G00342000 [Umbra pygmaea]|uniref:Uncharacterized protein n=1 Tax=Umbra pygmaea TaxID=75934 RepID=A0ABD0WJ02_UMBPY